ncbi:SubName: Full=Related to deacetylase {ECO:0000313/EMBL:CCA68305.1} [Serendipita indica DSM 11827]|uniref:Related to deacetylase n=1 Tax=Serendipita indica (strain DSM 11827) TaxID=1109443 RepID=G4TAG2_SERID|nr:SubName: Full=Related to deacetylase {ECO:0000313/EMBL:CCA68305.1} [Serendipita indica DSM 11827]CCA68305.1 related to deacetylase [Serendipita indica DSM 11827]
MFPASFVAFVAAALVVRAAPLEKKGLAQVISNCNHDFAYTWDDGPYTAHRDINSAFNRNNGKTTFFMNGDNWSCIYNEDNVQAIRQSFEQGHMLASHTWSHAHLTQLSDAQIDYEIQRLDEAFVKIVGVIPKFLRPPYGDIDERTASYIQQKHGKTIVLWSDDSGDSTGGSTQQSINFYNTFANENPKRPHMALSHETEPSGYNAMYSGTVDNLASHGVQLVTVAQCLDTDAYIYVGGYQQRDSSWYCGGSWTPSPGGGTCVQTYTSKVGDTCASIESQFGLPSGSILAANSFLNCNDIWVNTPICIPRGGTTTTRTSTTSPSTTRTSTSSTPAPTCVQTYTSKAGDTCASIEGQFGLQSGSILAANSFLNCQDIWVNTPICIPPGGSTTTRTTTTPTSTSTSGPAPTCVSTYTAVAGDTCAKIEYNYELPAGSIQAANPSWLNCADIWAYTPICIPPGGSGCTLKISTASTDRTCAAVASRYGTTAALIQAWNPSWLNCNDVWPNTPLCVRH